MSLTAQIELMTNPQEFTRLCNMVLSAEYGMDFRPIDDDRPDRGNDGYVLSEKRLFAMHCFKRVQNQSLDGNIRAKMMSDLRKAIELKREGAWEIEAWTFISNYPIPEAIGREILLAGRVAGIDGSWRGADFLAGVLQKAKNLRSAFPNLQANEVMDQLNVIIGKLENDARPSDVLRVNWVPQNEAELEGLLVHQPPGWEYLQFAGVLLLGKRALEPKWLDYQSGFAPRSGRYLDPQGAIHYLAGALADATVITSPVETTLSHENQTRAFGAPGEPGDPLLIEHLAKRVLSMYEGLLDWATRIRGVGFPDRFRRAAELAAGIAARPAGEIRAFIDHVVYELGRVPELAAREDRTPVRIDLALTLTADDRVIRAFNHELHRIHKELGYA